MKVIFLDVDGVLNDNKTAERLHGMYFVDDEKVERLKTIVFHTGAKLVLSSSWREGWYDQEAGEETEARDMYEALVDKLAEYGLELYDKTERHEHGTNRGDEIVHWLDDQEMQFRTIDGFIILDDLPPRHFGRYLSERLIQTDFYNGGLTPRLAGRTITMLKRQRSERP